VAVAVSAANFVTLQLNIDTSRHQPTKRVIQFENSGQRLAKKGKLQQLLPQSNGLEIIYPALIT